MEDMASVRKTQRGMEAHRAASASRAMRTGKKMTPVVIKSSGICRTCSVLPIGSAELTSLLLVLVFSLVAVLFTAVLALDSQSKKISSLETQVQVAQNK